MIRIRDECVGCPSDMGCMGNSCPYINVPVHICDNRGCDCEAEYNIDGDEFCESCTIDYIKDVFNSLNFTQKIETVTDNYDLTYQGKDTCERCNAENAACIIDGIFLCKSCAEGYLDEAFNQLSFCENVEYLGLEINEIGI